MALKLYRCFKCGLEFKTKKPQPEHCSISAELLIAPPSTKFLEKKDADHNKSSIVGQEKMLRERARKHSRDVEIRDLIEMNDKKTAFENRWLKADGTVRKALDDL